MCFSFLWFHLQETNLNQERQKFLQQGSNFDLRLLHSIQLISLVPPWVVDFGIKVWKHGYQGISYLSTYKAIIFFSTPKLWVVLLQGLWARASISCIWIWSRYPIEIIELGFSPSIIRGLFLHQLGSGSLKIFQQLLALQVMSSLLGFIFKDSNSGLKVSLVVQGLRDISHMIVLINLDKGFEQNHHMVRFMIRFSFDSCYDIYSCLIWWYDAKW